MGVSVAAVQWVKSVLISTANLFLESFTMINPRALRKLPFGDRCRFYAHEPLIICAIFPTGPVGESCLHFAPNPDHGSFEDFLGLQLRTGGELDYSDPAFSNPFGVEPDEEVWQPEGASYYNGKLILQPQQHWTREEQLELLDYHPMFTGSCPQCELPFPRYERPPVHWDCPACGWVDDTV